MYNVWIRLTQIVCIGVQLGTGVQKYMYKVGLYKVN